MAADGPSPGKRALRAPPRQTLRANERWEQILAVAADLFAAKGFHGASLDEIGERLGVQKTALYHYVRGKEDLLVEIYDRMLRKAEAEVLPRAALPLPPDERLRRMVTRYLELMVEDAAMWSLVHYQQNALPEADRRAVLRRKRAFERALEGVIREGQEAGLFKPMPARLVALAIYGMCNFVHYWIQFVRFPIEEITGVICELAERGLAETGEARTGAWPRATTPAEAFAGTAAGIEELKAQVDTLSAAFARDRQRLQDGLVAEAVPAPRRRRRAGAGR